MEIIFFLLAAGIGLIPHLITSILSFIFFLFGVGLGLVESDAEFLALIFMLIYVGAIAVLFLFVTMLIHFFETISPVIPTEGDQNDPFTPRSEGEGTALSYSFFEFCFIIEDFEEDSFDIFHDCLDEEYTISIFELLEDSHDFFVTASLLFTLYFVPLVICTFILLLITVGLFFTLFLRK